MYDRGQHLTMRDGVVNYYYRLLEKFLRPIVKRSVSPAVISIFSLLISIAAAVFYSFGMMFWGGLFLILSGFADTLDGTVARLSGKVSKFGALLDSSLDRWSDFVVYAGLLLYYRECTVFYAVLLSIIGSFMVSYVKARAESLGTIRIVGLMQRPERLLLLAAASLIAPFVDMVAPAYGDAPLVAILWFMAILTNVTALHRLFSAKRDLSGQE